VARQERQRWQPGQDKAKIGCASDCLSVAAMSRNFGVRRRRQDMERIRRIDRYSLACLIVIVIGVCLLVAALASRSG
jgi:hypothetical protein